MNVVSQFRASKSTSILTLFVVHTGRRKSHLSKLSDFIDAYRNESDAEYLRHANKRVLLAYSDSGLVSGTC